MNQLVRTFLETCRLYGQEGVELEFRVPCVHKTVFDGFKRVLDASPAFENCGHEETKEEYASEGDARRITHEETGHVGYLYKQRMIKRPIDDGSLPVIGTVSVEQWGEPVEARFPIYRRKQRDKYRYRCWEVHLTSFQTNDPRYSDQDGALYDIEIELQPYADDMYKYTVDVLLPWGATILYELYALSGKDVSSVSSVSNPSTQDSRRSYSSSRRE